MYYVYALIDLSNSEEIFYIGKGKGDRWKHHLRPETYYSTKNKVKWSRIKSIRSKGFEPQVRFILEEQTEQDALDLEEFLICYFGREGIEPYGTLTNRLLGGSPYKAPSVPRKPLSVEARAKIGANTKRHLTGRKQPIEMIEKRRKSLLGRKGWNPTLEQKKAISERRKGTIVGPCKEETKKLISVANRGEKNGMYGRTHSDAARCAIAQSAKDDKLAFVEQFTPILINAISRCERSTQRCLMNVLDNDGVLTRQGKKWKPESISYVLRQCGVQFGNLAKLENRASIIPRAKP